MVLSSDHVLQEVERALGRPFFAKRIAAADSAGYLALVRREALVITPRTKVRGVASDSQDDAVLAAALDGGARYLVTGDQALRDIGTFRRIDMVGPREFLDIVGHELGE
jgi:putative PIN family toxin of toxin-antitoxin system